LIPPAMFAILACVTFILLIVILLATSRNRGSGPGSERTQGAGSGKSASPSLSKGKVAATSPRMRQELAGKAVVKADSLDSLLATAKAVNLKPPTDSKVQPVAFPPTVVLTAAAEKTGGARANPEITARVEMSVAARASASAELKRSEVAELALQSAGGDPCLSSGSSFVPVHDMPATAPKFFRSLTGCEATKAAADTSEASIGLLIAEAEEELRAPNLLTFYGLKQQPFDVTPDPAYLYRSRVHREAFTAISQGVENLRGFMALIAEPGMGKTTLLNKLMEELGDSARVVFLFQTQCSSTELLRQLLTELEVEFDGTDIVAMHKALSQALFEEMLQSRRFVLIVDEAQNLQDSVLETIRLLSNYETTHSKLIQIVLAGQPQLVETLMRPGLVQLRQRIAVLANLGPLDATETAEYIEHRLRAAGSDERPIFTRDALALIAERSQGIPRSINNICFNAMLAGYLHRQWTINSEIVNRVASKLDLELLVRRPQREAVEAPESSDEPIASLSLAGRLHEKVTSQSWSNKNEFQIQVSLERDHLRGLPVADHYYCRSFYVSEDQAKSLQPGKAVRVRFEQD
jgi:general secretion pathway protein A